MVLASEVLHFRTDLTQADTDGDGLTDGEEVRKGSNPNLDDTDGDGVTNAKDLCLITTPMSEMVDQTTECSLAQSCPCKGPRGTVKPWKNQGEYVSCVTKTANNLAKAGQIRLEVVTLRSLNNMLA
jgi:hypothetical protein